jgi:hypothetical protein
MSSYTAGSGCTDLLDRYQLPSSCFLVTDDDDDDASLSKGGASSQGAFDGTAAMRADHRLRGPSAPVRAAAVVKVEQLPRHVAKSLEFFLDAAAAKGGATVDKTAAQRVGRDLPHGAHTVGASAKAQLTRAAHPAAAVETPTKAARQSRTQGTHSQDATAVGAVPSVVPAPAPATTPGTTQTDDDVNYYDDDGDDRTYVYDDFVYVYPHEDDTHQDDVFTNDDHAGDVDDYNNPADDPYADDTSFYIGGLDPPPSVSSTPFPTTPSQLNPVYSTRLSCQSAKHYSSVSFKVTQTIGGISLTTYNADEPTYSLTLKQTIAGSVSGATTDSVTNLMVSAGPTTTAGLRNLFTQHTAREALATESIAASYTVTVQDSAWSADALSGQLQTTISSGTFDSQLHMYAQQNGATGFQNATTDSVEVTDVSTSGSGGGGGSNKLSAGAIAGIVLGVLAFVGLCVTAAVFLLCRKRAPAASTATQGAGQMQVNPLAQGRGTPQPPTAVAQAVPYPGASAPAQPASPAMVKSV